MLLCVGAGAGALGPGCGARHRAGHPTSSAELCAEDKRSAAAEAAQDATERVGVPDLAALVGWRRLVSTHFTLTTDQSAADAEHTLRELEEYIAALTSVAFPITLPTERIPVVGLGSPRETRRYLRTCFDGVFVHGLLYQPVIVLGTGPRGIDDQIARHELVHYTMRLAYRRSLPGWYSEGMASYFETLAYDRTNGYLLFGRASLSRVTDLRSKGPLLPLETLATGGFDKMAVDDPVPFYAGSWLLVHALIHAAPEVFGAYDKALIGGANPSDAWLSASAGFRAGGDTWITDYFRAHRYEGGRRTPWQAPPMTITAAPVGAGDLLATLALLHAVGIRQQPERAAWHRARATEAAALALRQDPTQLEALQVQATLGPMPPAEAVRPALPGREQSWVSWLFFANAIASEHRPATERTAALARAAALAPDEPMVLLELASDALAAARWREAGQLFERGLAFAPDEPQFATGYLAAVAHDARCGSAARDALRRYHGSTDAHVWSDAARAVETCRAQPRTGGAP